MRTFSFDIPVAVEQPEVLSSFWRLESWPSLTEHVTGIDIHYEDEVVQVLTMTVQSGNRTDKFKTVRMLKGNAIYYFQPSPPPLLRHHQGNWVFSEAPQGCRITSEHTYAINLEQAPSILEGMGLDHHNPAEAVETLLKHNSAQTMQAIRRKLEARAEAVA